MARTTASAARETDGAGVSYEFQRICQAAPRCLTTTVASVALWAKPAVYNCLVYYCGVGVEEAGDEGSGSGREKGAGEEEGEEKGPGRTVE